MELFGFNKFLIVVCCMNMRIRVIVVYIIVLEWVNFIISCGFD